MKENMTQKYYDLLVSAGLLRAKRPHGHTHVKTCLCTASTKEVGVAMWSNKHSCLCVIYPYKPDPYNHVIIHYERSCR